MVSHFFAPQSIQILSYINICNINRKLLAQVFYQIFQTFWASSQNTFLSADFCMV